MLKNFNPNKAFFLTTKILKTLFFIFIIILIIGLTESLWISPEDYKQSHSVRIMYVHVPSAWISLGIFAFIGILSLFNFIFKNKNFSLIAKSLSTSGFVFCIIALVTGSIWGYPTWGTWWVWDARITSMLLLSIFYLMYILSWKVFEKNINQEKISSIIAIIGMINVPIIKFSVDWWNTLHQNATVKIFSKSSIHPSMMLPLLIMTVAFALFSLIIFIMEYRAEVVKLKNKGLDRL
jgi:heme exporter protein C|tara:strand:+ start:316 stop:1023 length:708 start_codon:yes stop_codon:yes gene_type:complete